MFPIPNVELNIINGLITFFFLKLLWTNNSTFTIILNSFLSNFFLYLIHLLTSKSVVLDYSWMANYYFLNNL
jgi:hypothetical protein